MNISSEYIVKMLSLPKIGRRTAFMIISKFPSEITCNNDLIELIKLASGKIKLPAYSRMDFDDAFSKAEDILCNSAKNDIKIVSFLDDEYPKLLMKSKDFPIVLNYVGNIGLLNNKPSVAVIGTRQPTNFGLKIGTRFSEYIAQEGFNIVSGLAIGCDTAGHKGALKARGSTVAVMAHGLDSVYPKENKDLAQEIIDNDGLLLSEYFVNKKQMRSFFVERDRIQAGLSLGVVVVETGIKGGTMHTVDACLSNKRILASINHPRHHLSERSEGNQYLISSGKAMPIYNKEEVDSLLTKLKIEFDSIDEVGDKYKERYTYNREDNSVKYDKGQAELSLWG